MDCTIIQGLVRLYIAHPITICAIPAEAQICHNRECLWAKSEKHPDESENEGQRKIKENKPQPKILPENCSKKCD